MRTMLAILFTALLSSTAWASGKIIAQDSYNPAEGKNRTMLGLSIYENLWVPGYAVNSWVGYGDYGGGNWFNARLLLDRHLGKVTLSAGYEFLQRPESIPMNEHLGVVRASYQLW